MSGFEGAAGGWGRVRGLGQWCEGKAKGLAGCGMRCWLRQTKAVLFAAYQEREARLYSQDPLRLWRPSCRNNAAGPTFATLSGNSAHFEQVSYAPSRFLPKP